MRFRLERRRRASAGDPHVVEVVTPRTNAASLTSAENLLAAIGLAESFALEVAVDRQARRFLVRAGSASMRDHLESQLGAAYPQANLRQVASEDDAALCRPDEQVQCRMLALRAPAYLPIRTFSDLEIDGEHASQADPVLGILGALGELPPGWRGLSQLVLEPTTDDWCRDYLRFAVQHPLAPERMARPTENSGAFVVFLALLLGLGAFGLQAYAWYRAHDWPALVGGGAAAMIAVAVVAWVARRLLRRPLYDMDLVRQKVSRLAYRVELRLSVFAPAAVDRGEVAERMERFVAAYRHFNLAAGNGFRVRRTRIDVAGCDLRCPRAIVPRRPSILTTRELAGLWHLPHAAADVALLERTTARRWLPLPASVVDGFRIGEAGHQSRRVPVAIPSDILRRHLLLVAKTRRGKSSLMLRMAQHAMLSQPRRAVLLVDPHRDLAEAALGLVPPERRDDAVYVDVSDVVRPVGLNVLDTGLGWDRDRAVANALAIFQREWGDRFWGPRMEDAFRFGLLSLFAANQALCASDPIGGRSKQYTLLDLPSVFGDTAFRRMVLRDVSDPTIKRWWSTYFGTLDQRFRLEIVNPILTKIHRFEGSAAARLVVGQPMSTLDPAAWLRDGAVVIVNTARGTVGENAAALLGGTLLNLVSLAVAEQARLAPEERAAISIFVDEFHTIPGADYEAILAELNKYGASLVLATQSLGRLLGMGGGDDRGLRATVFANLDGLFAFNCSAEDARYLVPELGGAIDEQDLLELGEHQCYVRLSAGGERLPTFSVALDPPPVSDVAVRLGLARASAQRYGRDVAVVEAERNQALEQIAALRAAPEPELAVETAPTIDPQRRPRNEHRGRRKRKTRQVEEMPAYA